ncbi:MAG: DUF3732 domain-containing protein, partial [Candidatus Omnitrophota bacterium]
LGHMKVANEYGLLDEKIAQSSNPDDLLDAARRILEVIPEHSKTSFENIKSANEEISQLEKEETKLSNDIGQAKKRLADIDLLRSGLVDYGHSVRKRADRLQISQWLSSILSEKRECLACGSLEHPKAAVELEKVSAAFRKVENEALSVAEIPSSFAREEAKVKSNLEDLLDKQKKLQKRYDLLMSQDKKAQEEFQRNQSMFMFLGHLRASLETFERLADGGEFQREIMILEEEYKDLQSKVDAKGVQRRVDAATAKIGQKMQSYLMTLDVEEKYKQISPKFSVKDLNIKVLSNDDNWHFLAEVGSASNWVSFHLALMCALQEYFIEQKLSCVPSLVIFDQPSQVYFPKLNREQKKVEDDPQYQSEDVEAVKSMFRTLAKAVLASNGGWQSIILDHADSGIYGDIDGVCEVAEWRGGDKLIPVDWMST